ncbi:hypothetical protein MMC27_000849 [Xylographa pallens]|nr:hypothetical protein [Xylographa pallens]
MPSSNTLNAAVGPVFPPELFFSIVAQIGDVNFSVTPILSDVAKLTLSNLRLVNKAVHEIATPYLFHTIVTWLTQYQFDRLGIISRKEHLRHHIKRIVFRPWEVRDIGDGNYLQEIWCCDLRTYNRLMPAELTFKNFNNYVQNFSLLPLTSQERSGYRIFGTAPELRQTWSPPTYTEEFLRQSQREYRKLHHIQYLRRWNYAIDQGQLKAAFVNFDNLMHIAMAPQVATPGNNRFLELTGIAPHPYWCESGRYLISAVIVSLEAAKAKIRFLEIDTGRSEHYFLDEEVFDIFELGSMYSFLVPFGGLEKLCIANIRNRADGNQISYPGPMPPAPRPIAKLLETTTSLKELTLGMHQPWSMLYDIHEMIPATLKLEHLRSLTLHWFPVEEKKLFQILDAHRLTLRTLNLHHIIITLGTWSSLAGSIRARLKLTAANISDTLVLVRLLGLNNVLTQAAYIQRSCFAFHQDRDFAGSLDDYITRKIDYNPITRATETGYQVEQDDWLPGTVANEGWMPKIAFGCGCNKHRQIPEL